jgi:hypothetical protein
MHQGPEYTVDAILEEALDLFSGYTFPDPPIEEAQWTEIQFTVKDVLTLLALMEETKENLQRQQFPLYNRRQINETVDSCSIYQWLIRPGFYSGRDMDNLLYTVNRILHSISAYLKEEKHATQHAYVRRQIKPLITNYMVLLEAIKTLYF